MSPLNLTTALLITQFVLLAIVFSGVLILRAGENSLSVYSENPRPATKHFPSYLFGFALITLACIFFSEDLVVLSRPVFGNLEFPALARSDAFLIVFVLNVFGAGVLVKVTGGARESPFGAVLFALPALAIFLREQPERYFMYTAFAVGLFLVFQRPSGLGVAVVQNPRHQWAYNLVTLGVLALSTLVGFVTRPT